MAASLLRVARFAQQKLDSCLILRGRTPDILFNRLLSVSSCDCIKRKWISKWKNSFPDQVYTEGVG